MKRPKTCIFCGIKGNISKEHFWPEWLAPHLSPTTVNAHITELHEGEFKQPIRLQRRSERQGAVNTKKIRVVCIACNNQWMSAVESSAKPVLLGLLDGSTRSLSLKAVKALSVWVAVKSILGEHSTEGTALTPPADRLVLYERREVPSYFRFFMAFHSLRTESEYYRHSTTVSRSMSGPTPSLPEGITRNIHATTFLVGRLCFYVTAVRVSEVSTALLDPSFPMHRIWPNPDCPLDLGSMPPLNDVQVQIISRSLERLVQHPQVKYGGPIPSIA